jgi:serine/threonine protein kinase
MKKGGNTFGEGQLGQIVDYKELGPINSLIFYDINKQECLSISSNTNSNTISFLNKIVFKDFFNQNSNINSSKTKIKKFIDNNLFDKDDYLFHEIANMQIVGRLSIETPLFEYQNRKILFTVLNQTKIMPVYEKYDMDLYKLSKMPKLLTEEKVITIFRSLLNTLEVLHQNELYHFDIKPANILYQKNTNKAVLADYGFLNSTEGINYIEGSPLYQSPFFRLWGFDCPSEDTEHDCNNIINSYDEMRDYYLFTVNDLMSSYASCNGNSVKEFVDNCIGHITRSKTIVDKLKNRNSKYFGSKFAENIEEALTHICPSSQTQTQAKKQNTNNVSTCVNVKYLAKELARIILQKNELYALGTTFKQFINNMPTTDTKNKLMTLIDKMRRARLFENYDTREQDFYYIEEAIEYFETFIEK